MAKFPFVPQTTARVIFRCALAGFLLIHGVTRIAHGTVGGFGEFLESQGFPLGLYLAWGITLFEIIGSTLLMTRYFVRWICLIFMVELTSGIVLAHFQNGWFVVGGGTGGMEYSVLLIFSFFLVAASEKSA